MAKKIAFLCLILSTLVTGCATPGAVTLPELDIPFVELQKVVEGALPLGRRSQSSNGREFFSEFFTIKNGEYEDAAQSAVRHYAHILILGDRKPYNIDVVVVVERRGSSGEYTLSRHDQGLAKVISRRIQTALHKRRDGRNIIDDFRVF